MRAIKTNPYQPWLDLGLRLEKKSQLFDKHGLFKGQSDDTNISILPSKMQH